MNKLILFCIYILVTCTTAASTDTQQPAPVLRVVMTSPDGKPIPKAEIIEFYCCDMDGDGLYTPATIEDGLVLVTLPSQPIQLSVILKVPGYGQVGVFADNGGKGYTRAGTIDFAADAAATRLMRVKTSLKHAEGGGVEMPKDFYDRMARAEKLKAYDSLAVTLLAGEELTLARAQKRISKLSGPRKDFFFGCNSMPQRDHNEAFDAAWLGLFNYATFNMYMGSYAPGENTRDYARPDWEYNWLVTHGVKNIKPCPPIYMAGSCTPGWMRTKTWPELQKILYDLVFESCNRYKENAGFCEIVNEAHDTSNSLNLTKEQLTEAAVIASKAARAANPNVQRIINSCHIWGEYTAKLNKAGLVRRTPYQYLQDCIKAGAEFEIVGLQLYYPDRDLFEIDRTFERYAKLGKPIHITEIECSSQPGKSPTCARKKMDYGWRGGWSEKNQADWVEGIYTIAYSRPYIKVISWWSLKDGNEFWHWGGLLHTDCTPKPAYQRLKSLQEKWGYKPEEMRK